MVPMLSRHKVPALNLLLVFAVSGCGGGGGGTATPKSVTVQGTVSAAAYTTVDSDLNDPASRPISNDTTSAAQQITAPATVGGYANLAGAGPDGNSKQAGDPQDVYRVELKAGMQIMLHVAPSETGSDLDLLLVTADEDRSAVDGSFASSTLDMIDVPHDGPYYLIVQAVAGAANYILSITGQGIPAVAPIDLMRLSDDFVPGEVILKLKENGGSRSAAAPHSAGPGLTRKAGGRGEPMLFAIAESGPAAQLAPVAIAGQELRMSDKARRKLETIRTIKRLRKRSDIAYAEPNYVRHALTVPNDPLYARQWHYPLINLPQAWDLRNRDPATEPVVAVVDTGILMNHPDLQGVLTADGYDFIRDPAAALDGDGIDSDPSDPGDQSSGGSSFHGTHVAGTIAARTNNGTGIAGVSWGARIMPLRALGKGSGSSYDVQQAVRYAAGMSNSSGRLPARTADIINLSLGGAAASQAEQELVRQVRARGIIVIAAAGNSATNTPFYPAAYDGVVGVSAVDRYGARAPYSNYGSFVDLAAPGGNLDTDLDGDGYADGVLSTGGRAQQDGIALVYRLFHGTSMAAPHVAGVVALMKAIAPTLTPADFDSLLAAGSLTNQAEGAARNSSHGYGLIDAYKSVIAAYQLVGGDRPAPMTSGMSVAPDSVTIGPHHDAAVIRAVVTDGSESPISAFVIAGDWLAVAATAVDGHGAGYYTVAVDRTGLAAGSHSGKLVFSSTAGMVHVPVSLEVDQTAPAGNVGTQYVLLIDSASGTPLAQRVIETNGEFAFRGLSGDYAVVAGTDANNDGYICGAGEACAIQLSGNPALTTASATDASHHRLVARFDPTLRLRVPSRGFKRLN